VLQSINTCVQINHDVDPGNENLGRNKDNNCKVVSEDLQTCFIDTPTLDHTVGIASSRRAQVTGLQRISNIEVKY
jgi:hypothetical protein